MDAYCALTEFWHRGLLVAKGEVVHLTQEGAKYLGHVVERVEDAVVNEAHALDERVTEVSHAGEDCVEHAVGDVEPRVAEDLGLNHDDAHDDGGN